MKNTNKTKIYQAIIIGHLLINIPIIAICLGLPYLVTYLNISLVLKVILVIVAFFLSIGVSWIFWSISITKWRIWAFNQVEEEDWVKLKEMAIAQKLIWPVGSVFEKTEIRNTREKDKIEEVIEIVYDLELIEEIKLDLLTPYKIGYKINKRFVLVESVAHLFLFVVAIGLLIAHQFFIATILFLVIIMDRQNHQYLKFVFSNEDYLILNDNGVQFKLPKNQFIYWGDVEKMCLYYDTMEMVIIRMTTEGRERIVCKLKQIKIPNFILFEKQLKLFLERYHIKLYKSPLN